MSNLPKINLNIKDALSFEKHRRRADCVYIFKCAKYGCLNKIRVDYYRVAKYTGYCVSCQRKKRPFGVVYNRLLSNCKKKKVENTITYNELLEFTKINQCAYCLSNVEWVEFTSMDHGSVAYNLDRKDPNKGYSKENCVVCCKICNWSKNDLFTHEEFLKIGYVIGEILKKRAERLKKND